MTQRLLYLLRRWWWRRTGMRVDGRCCDCGVRLSLVEIEYYERTCERCEGELNAARHET